MSADLVGEPAPRFAEVMANLDDFLTYTRRQGTTLTVACCPMTHNWHELPALVADRREA